MDKERKKELLKIISELDKTFDESAQNSYRFIRARKKLDSLYEKKEKLVNKKYLSDMGEEVFLEKQVSDMYTNYLKLEDIIPFTSEEIRSFHSKAMDLFNQAEVSVEFSFPR